MEFVTETSKNSTLVCGSTMLSINPDIMKPIDIVYQPPNEVEIKMLENTKTPAQIVEEEQSEKLDKSSEVDNRRKIGTRLKVIALDRLGKHPLMNPSYLSQREKNKVIQLMISLQDNKEEDIIKEFNDICNDVLFSGNADPSKYPVYKY